MLLGLGQITQKEVDRHGEAAMMIGKSSFKYAWCCDTTQVERERGISTSLSHRSPPFELTLTRSWQRGVSCATLRVMRGAAIEWKAKECRLTNGREIEIVDVPGHCDFKRSAFIVRAPCLHVGMVEGAHRRQLECTNAVNRQRQWLMWRCSWWPLALANSKRASPNLTGEAWVV